MFCATILRALLKIRFITFRALPLSSENVINWERDYDLYHTSCKWFSQKWSPYKSQAMQSSQSPGAKNVKIIQYTTEASHTKAFPWEREWNSLTFSEIVGGKEKKNRQTNMTAERIVYERQTNYAKNDGGWLDRWLEK